MEDPKSEGGDAAVEQNETGGEKAAEALPGGDGLQPEDSLAELPVADIPPNPPDQTAEEIAADEAEKDTQAEADSKTDPAEDEPAPADDVVLKNQDGDEIDGDTEVPTAGAGSDEPQPEKSLEETLENDPPPDADRDLASELEDGLKEIRDDPESLKRTEVTPQIAVSAGLLPQYKCHKTVQAFKIGEMEALPNGDIQLISEGDTHSVIVNSAYVDRHRPQIGGYYVRYHDGYRSWSPADTFEDGYTPVEA